MNKLVKIGIVECLGTFVLVLLGCGIAVTSGVDLVATALAFGLSVVAMAYAIGHVSGCHINPAVSIAMLINKKISLKEFAIYVCSQLVGATIGALTLWLFIGSKDALGANQAQVVITDAYSSTFAVLAIALLVEVVLTFIFVYVILGVTSKEENSSVAGLVIGLTLVLVHLLGIALTGTSVNPARSFGPAILEGGEALKQLWVFIVAPLIGGALAAISYKFINKPEEVK